MSSRTPSADHWLAACLSGGTRKLGAPVPCVQPRQDVTFVELGIDDGRDAIAVAVESFLTEPEMTTDFCLGPDNSADGGPESVKRRGEVVNQVMTLFWNMHIHEGRCFGIRGGANGELLTVAFCMPPGAIRNGDASPLGRELRTILRLGGVPLPLTPQGDAKFGCARRRFEAVMKVAEGLHKRCAHMRHWYVQVLATSPKGQGKGLGTTLLECLRAMAAEDGAPIYLETVGEKNRDFYQNRGYEIQSAGRVTDGTDSILVYGLRLDHDRQELLKQQRLLQRKQLAPK